MQSSYDYIFYLYAIVNSFTTIYNTQYKYFSCLQVTDKMNGSVFNVHNKLALYWNRTTTLNQFIKSVNKFWMSLLVLYNNQNDVLSVFYGHSNNKKLLNVIIHIHIVYYYNIIIIIHIT